MKQAVMSILIGIVLTILTSETLVRLIAANSPQVNYLANAGLKTERPRANSLKEFLENPDFQLSPHSDWYGYAKNNLGLVDRDIQFPKPSGNKRIVAIGDSFTHGAVPYPANVMSVAESVLSRTCPNENIEIVNLGMPGARVYEYEQVLEHTLNELQPDAVILNFYLGNDGPNILKGKDNFPDRGKAGFHSYFLRYLTNSITLLRGTKQKELASPNIPPTIPTFAGAQATGAKADFSDDASPLNVPTIEEKEWAKVSKDELSHFFHEKDKHKLDSVWERTIRSLSRMSSSLKAKAVPFQIFLYPSELQIDRSKQEAAMNSLREERRWTSLGPDDFNFKAPAAYLLAWCKESSVDCFDLSEKLFDAAEHAGRSIYIPQNTHWNILGNHLAGTIQGEMLGGIACRDASTNGANFGSSV